MDNTDRSIGFFSRPGSLFTSGTHQTTIHDGDDNGGRIATPSPPPRSARALNGQANQQHKKQSLASSFFEHLGALVELAVTHKEDEITANIYMSCARALYYTSAGITVWQYFSEEARANMKYGWETEIFEANGSEGSIELLKKSYVQLLRVRNEQCNQTSPHPIRMSATIEKVKVLLFGDLLVAAANGAANMKMHPPQLQHDLRALLESGVKNDDLIDVLYVSLQGNAQELPLTINAAVSLASHIPRNHCSSVHQRPGPIVLVSSVSSLMNWRRSWSAKAISTGRAMGVARAERRTRNLCRSSFAQRRPTLGLRMGATSGISEQTGLR